MECGRGPDMMITVTQYSTLYRSLMEYFKKLSLFTSKVHTYAYCIFQPKLAPAERGGQLSDYELRFIGDHLGGNLNVTNCLKNKSCVSNSVRSTTVDKVEDVKTYSYLTCEAENRK